jgi:hypothetical protein
MNPSLRLLAGPSLVLLLACGGGGDSGDKPQPTPAPVITNISPTSGPAGTTVVISGTNLNGATAVSFAGTAGTILSSSTSSVSATVPAGAASGPITVTTPGGQASSSTFTRTAGSLAYTDPASGTYRLMRNAGSTATHLVLDLVGPAGTLGRGVGFYLTADTTKVTWAKVAASDAELVQNGDVFTLGGGQQLIKAKASGDTLQAGVYQKGAGVSAKPLNATLARVALDLKGSPSLGTIALGPVAGKTIVVPETGAQTVITVSVGTLTAQ